MEKVFSADACDALLPITPDGQPAEGKQAHPSVRKDGSGASRGAERDILPIAQRYGLGTLAWSPLSGGWLTGKYRRDAPPPVGSRGDINPDHFDGTNQIKLTTVERLSSIADEAGLSLTHMSLAWATEHPALSAVLIGPRTEQQLDDLLEAADVTLTPDILDAIDAVVPPGTTINPADIGWNPPGLATNARRRKRS